MTISRSAHVLQSPAFQGLSPNGQSKIEAALRFVRFKVGQSLCDCRVLPSQVILILEGRARLLSNNPSQLLSIASLGEGDWVGMASLLRAAPCETVAAATEILAAAIPDTLWLELYQSEPEFRLLCDSTLWPAELENLVGHEQIFPLLEAGAALLEPKESALAAALASEQHVFLASANTDLDIGTRLTKDQALPETRGPLPLRLISLPARPIQHADAHHPTTQQAATQNGIGHSEGSNNAAVSNAILETHEADPVPLSSNLDLGQPSSSRALELIPGKGALEETLASFQMLAKMMKLPFRRDSIDKALRDSLRRGQKPNLQFCGQLAASLGLHVVGAKVPATMGTRLQTPALIPWGEGFALASDSNASGLRLASPAEGWIQIAPDALEEAFPDGIDILMMDRTASTPEQKFGVSWFWPALKRYRGILTQVLVASFVVQLFSLANPLLIQVIIDKVISQRSLDTLQVLGIALVVVTLLEGVINSLRTFLFAETTNRIDMRLGAEVIDHLLRLPLGYFDQRPVGELGSRIAELEKIRNFLTGQALTTILDGLFSVIYIIVMAFYSWLLTIVALIVLPIQVALTILGAPLFRRQFRQAATENAKTQSHLVEILTGIQTVKAQNVELVSRWKWQDLYNAYISRTFEKTVTGTALNETSQVLQKLSQLLVLWVGAVLVLKGEMTLGQLIAFRIISGYVTQPLLRLSTIWQNIQELRVSFERLADVVDTPQESSEADKKNIPLPPIAGQVKFEALNFAFRKGAEPILKNINLNIEAGTFVGVVGQSGSGKSTLMKLLPRLYAPDSGRILIDGTNISKVELYSLRRQIGIVPQDPLLFAGTVAENIALTDPDTSSDAIVTASKIACAHEFIMDLPAGYSSDVGERGAGLSGGQRQRIAIARTLLSNPKLLVMDEATSALDYDTERRVCDNLKEALVDCTVFFITHRLSTIRRADLIVMMHQGSISETGTHDELMALRGRYYALYRQQEAV